MQRGYICTVLVLLLVNLRRVEGKALLTNSLTRRIEAFSGETVRFNWNYTVDDKNMDFGYYVSSPIWYYYNPDGAKVVIAVDDGLRDWKWVISRHTCPPRLLNPTVRVSKESVATLVISNVTKNDSGWYEICLSLRTSPSIYNKVELVVTDKRARFTKVPSSTLFVAKGKAARFEWNYTYDNRNIEFNPESPVWAYIDKNNQWVTIATEKKDQLWSAIINTTTCPARLLNPNRVSIEQPATLVITNVTEADNGMYGCMLRLQKELPINSTSTLIVTDHPKVFVSTPRTKVIREGSDLNVTCRAKGSPVPYVTWVKITPQKGRVISRTIGVSLLEIKEIKRNQGGTYECKATNNPNEPPVTVRINVMVIYFKYSFIPLEKISEVLTVEGEDLNITCALSPTWFANVTWVRLFMHKVLKLENNEVNRGTLAIRNISRSQQGKYQCQAHDKINGILGTADVFIKVMYEPEIDEMLSDKHNIPWLGDTIYLRCVARGVPVPNVTWYGINGSTLVSGTSYHPRESTLKLLKLNGLNFGIYSCLAKNRYGMAWHNITVTRYCSCNQTEQTKKKKTTKTNNKPKCSSADPPNSTSYMLLALLLVSFTINAITLLILCKIFKGKQRLLWTKEPQEKTSAVELPSTYNDSTDTTGQIVLGNFNAEPPTTSQSDSTPNGQYEELSSDSFKISSPRNYEQLDPTSREQHRPKGFQTFGNHMESSYEQLQLATSFPVYQRLNNSNNMKSCI